MSMQPKYPQPELRQAHSWTGVLSELRAQKSAVLEAIGGYPPPIPACDVQFNSLLETRADLTADIKRAHRLAGARGSSLEFVQQSRFLSGRSDN